MRDGLRVFTNFTNVLKRMNSTEREGLFRAAEPVEVKEIRSQVARLKPEAWVTERGRAGKTYYPKLPTPKQSDDKRMVFLRPLSQVRKVARYLFDDPDTSPSTTAGGAFDHVLELAKGKR
jgi:hypothetical protein